MGQVAVQRNKPLDIPEKHVFYVFGDALQFKLFFQLLTCFRCMVSTQWMSFAKLIGATLSNEQQDGKRFTVPEHIFFRPAKSRE